MDVPISTGVTCFSSTAMCSLHNIHMPVLSKSVTLTIFTMRPSSRLNLSRVDVRRSHEYCWFLMYFSEPISSCIRFTLESPRASYQTRCPCRVLYLASSNTVLRYFDSSLLCGMAVLTHGVLLPSISAWMVSRPNLALRSRKFLNHFAVSSLSPLFPRRQRVKKTSPVTWGKSFPSPASAFSSGSRRARTSATSSSSAPLASVSSDVSL
mmetsp:Transcript_104642/g.296117  ORF Transcript_104642/g.296117 Transcript_104642/m.296117 type:complete len:209 (-) Transcript_104642:8-634(-)